MLSLKERTVLTEVPKTEEDRGTKTEMYFCCGGMCSTKGSIKGLVSQQGSITQQGDSIAELIGLISANTSNVNAMHELQT